MEKNERKSQADIVAQCEMIVEEYAKRYFAHEDMDAERFTLKEKVLIAAGAVVSAVVAIVLWILV